VKLTKFAIGAIATAARNRSVRVTTQQVSYPPLTRAHHRNTRWIGIAPVNRSLHRAQSVSGHGLGRLEVRNDRHVRTQHSVSPCGQEVQIRGVCDESRYCA
jgi:hypothetical protein